MRRPHDDDGIARMLSSRGEAVFHGQQAVISGGSERMWHRWP